MQFALIYCQKSSDKLKSGKEGGQNMIRKFISFILAALLIHGASAALELEKIESGDIELFEDLECTKEVKAPLGTRTVYPGKTYYIREKSSGRVFSGTTCYIYANAVYNALFGDVPYHGESERWENSVKLHGFASAVSYDLFQKWGVIPGSLMRTTREKDGSYNGNYGHSLIIIGYVKNAVTYLEGNGDGKGLIRIKTAGWAEFNKKFLAGKGWTMSFIVAPINEKLIGYYRRADSYPEFSDVKAESWYYQEVREAYELGLMRGVGKGRFSPEEELTRAQAVTIAARALSRYWDDRESFTGAGAWYEPYYIYLEKWGVSLSRENSCEIITRGELAELIIRVFPKNELEKIKNAEKTDGNEALRILSEAGIIEGSGGSLRENDGLKRSEAAAILVRLADRAKRIK